MQEVKELIEYVVDPSQPRITRTGGCLLARSIIPEKDSEGNDVEPQKVQIGYSFRFVELDEYDKNFGYALAEKRLHYLENANYRPRRVHPRYRTTLMLFLLRCKLYFQKAVFPAWVDAFLKDPIERQRTEEWLLKIGSVVKHQHFIEDMQKI